MKRLTLALVSFYSIIGFGQSAKEIVQKVVDKMEGNSNQAVMRMTIIRPDWKREITMKSWALGRAHSLILITGPARDKGQAFLKRSNEMWNWQPSIDRVIKLPPSMMLQSWMGSDFTNDDLVKESSVVEDYNHSLKADSTINGKKVYKIELIPKPDAPVVWGKIITYIDKQELNQLLVKYFDEEGELVNTMVMSEIKMIGGRLLPTKMEMIPADNPKQKTMIEYLELEFDLGLKEDFFSIQNMKRIR